MSTGTTTSTSTRTTKNEWSCAEMEDPQTRNLHVLMVYPQERTLVDVMEDATGTSTNTTTNTSTTARTTAKTNESTTTRKDGATTAEHTRPMRCMQQRPIWHTCGCAHFAVMRLLATAASRLYAKPQLSWARLKGRMQTAHPRRAKS